ncbi:MULTISPECIES: hypothetical protein [unclassified Corallococcus]|uniref:hypothetical protein n=1 Tax=unclassified Corallococcus TaxID=2685029 RepID=UPI001A8D8CF3|nr:MULTISPECIES: hypothetical protein [unclassified Corallococcus]MBN9685379.1 hypothetical protein [Corallococcus sp. NCSPR001]WAS83170.1 hypothetical protein O0N60_28095 [Corallococcus sp. NCRR]
MRTEGSDTKFTVNREVRSPRFNGREWDRVVTGAAVLPHPERRWQDHTEPLTFVREVAADWGGYLAERPTGEPAELPSVTVQRLRARIAELESRSTAAPTKKRTAGRR